MRNFYREKRSPKILGFFCNLKTSQSKHLPKRRKFVQSGRPADGQQVVESLEKVETDAK
jgi:hypothetical protein